MKRLMIMILPVLGLAVAVAAPTAYADHGGVQSPDRDDRANACKFAFVAHGSCTAEAEEALRWHTTGATRFVGLPTADGWHVQGTIRIINNDADTLELVRHFDVTFPGTWNLLYPDELFPGSPAVPVPNPWYGIGLGTENAFTSATCIVESSTGGEFGCASYGTGFPLPVPLPI